MRAAKIETPKERPILFSGPMVRAILEGRKTQTRRPIVSLAGIGSVLEVGATDTPGYLLCMRDRKLRWHELGMDGLLARCPYGQPGDRLWVRETWQYDDWTEEGEPWIRYQADHGAALRTPPEEWEERILETWARLSVPENYDAQGRAADRRWRPPVHMPRWASRILLEVTEVRVQWLQDISEEDALAEGIRRIAHGREGDFYHHERDEPNPKNWCHHGDALRALWDSLAKPGQRWGDNPWVWAVSFRRVP